MLFMDNTVLKRFCTIALLEGISCVLLFCITMPLKYTLGKTEPLWGQISYWTGMGHGILFILYAIILVQAWTTYKWSWTKAAVLFLASLIPFATFWVERKLKREPAKKQHLFS